LKHGGLSTESQKFEVVKAIARADMMIVESCFGKCGTNFSSSQLNPDCMIKCYNKYFDASMVWGPIYGRMLYLGLRIKIK
jgi:hypothetical protein